MRLGISGVAGKMRGVSDNPYQAPAVQEVAAPAAPLTDAEAIRKPHLKHEASLKAIGFLHLLGGVAVLLSLVAMAVAFGMRSTGSESPAGIREYIMMAGPIVLLGAIAVGQFISGWALRKLRPWAKIPAAIIAGISLLSIPVGTLLGGYTLYLLFSEKGRTILSPGYAEIMAQTPHLRYRTPLWIWIVLILLIVLILGLALFSGPAR
jgi:hypothetical protein